MGMIFDINTRYARTVRKTIQRAGMVGPWEIMPVAPGDPQEQLWVQDTGDAVFLKLMLPFAALARVYAAA